MEVKIKALIFDVGGVLFLAQDRKKRDGKNLLSSFREFLFLLKNKNLDLERQYNSLREIDLKSKTGKISKEETLKLFSKELRISPEKAEKIFNKVCEENVVENKKLYSYILKLKRQGYKIGISSIQSHISKKVLIPKKYRKNFDALQISCEDGFLKPDRKAFNFILNELGVKPEESVFVDDKQENLDVAEDLGMKTVLFENNKQFFLDLENLGIK